MVGGGVWEHMHPTSMDLFLVLSSTVTCRLYDLMHELKIDSWAALTCFVSF